MGRLQEGASAERRAVKMKHELGGKRGSGHDALPVQLSNWAMKVKASLHDY